MINDQINLILKNIPSGVNLVAATKGRTVSEIKEAVSAGITMVGENYVNEAQEKFSVLGGLVKWHFIGHLQKNKVKKAVALFDMIETVDSVDLAIAIERECEKINKNMAVLIEVNSGLEMQKGGVFPNDVENLIANLLDFKYLKVMGLMTMGPFVDSPELIRPFFKKTKVLFDKIKNHYSNRLEWRYLSMGMSDTYSIAIEEGANIIRIGTLIFGHRPIKN